MPRSAKQDNALNRTPAPARRSRRRGKSVARARSVAPPSAAAATRTTAQPSASQPRAGVPSARLKTMLVLYCADCSAAPVCCTGSRASAMKRLRPRVGARAPPAISSGTPAEPGARAARFRSLLRVPHASDARVVVLVVLDAARKDLQPVQLRGARAGDRRASPAAQPRGSLASVPGGTARHGWRRRQRPPPHARASSGPPPPSWPRPPCHPPPPSRRAYAPASPRTATAPAGGSSRASRPPWRCRAKPAGSGSRAGTPRPRCAAGG